MWNDLTNQDLEYDADISDTQILEKNQVNTYHLNNSIINEILFFRKKRHFFIGYVIYMDILKSETNIFHVPLFIYISNGNDELYETFHILAIGPPNRLSWIS